MREAPGGPTPRTPRRSAAFTGRSTSCDCPGLLCVLLALAFVASAAGAKPPRLVLELVFDQLGSPYLDGSYAPYAERLKPNGGFRRLLGAGTLVPRAEFTAAHSMTAPGHATIATGRWPSRTGIPINRWYGPDGNTAIDPAPRTCDGKAAPGSVRPDARALGDRVLARYPGSRSVAVTLKARAGFMLGGHHADWIVAFREGKWVSDACPKDAFAPPTVDPGQTVGLWADKGARAVGDACLVEVEQRCRAAEATPEDEMWKACGKSLVPVRNILSGGSWMVLEAIRHAVTTAHLGEDDVPDVLAVSFSAHDLVGHWCGPRSAAMLETFEQEDLAVAALLDWLGSERHLALGDDLLVVVTGDHGVAYETPIRACAPPRPGDNVIDMVQLADTLDGAVLSRFPACAAERKVTYGGSKVCTGSLYGTEATRFLRFVDLNVFVPKALDVCSGGQVAAVLDTLIDQAIVGRAPWTQGLRASFTGAEIASGAADRAMSGDYAERAFQHTYDPERSGHLVLVPSAGWVESQETLDYGRHLVGYRYDRQVPVLVAGGGVAGGRVCDVAFPMVDLAPTLAERLGLDGKDYDGRARKELFKAGRAPKGCAARGP